MLPWMEERETVEECEGMQRRQLAIISRIGLKLETSGDLEGSTSPPHGTILVKTTLKKWGLI